VGIQIGDLLPSGGGDYAATLPAFEDAGIDVYELANRLQPVATGRSRIIRKVLE